MLEIDTIGMREIRLPLKRPFATACGVRTVRRIILLEMRTRDGLAAWSECAALETPAYSPETIDTAWFAIREWLAPALRRQSIAHPSEVSGCLGRGVRGHRFAKAALEMGIWNLEAQRRGVSLSVLLGGTRSRIPVGTVIGMQPKVSMLVERALRGVEEGYRRIKIKIGPGADVRYVRAVRSEVGAEIPLAVDANASYSPDDVKRLCDLDEFGLTMIEQPLSPDDLLYHAELQRRLHTPVCLDESVTCIDQLHTMIRLGSARIVNVKPGRVGGLSEAIAIQRRCSKNGLGSWVGGMLESGIGRAYNVALSSLPGFTLPGDISPSNRYWEEDIVRPAWTMREDGLMDVPIDRPGLGVEVDRTRIETLTCRYERLAL